VIRALVFCLLVACGPPRRPPAAALDVDHPSLLVASQEIRPDFVLQQKVAARFGERRVVFQAVIQAARGRLTVIALSLQGTRVFTLEQTGRQVSFQRHTRSELPFSPRHILVDIHRAYFRGPGDSPRERVRDREEGGVLVERIVELVGAGEERIRIRYGQGGARLLERPVRYHNGYLGYTLEVTPVSFKLLEPAEDE
jgi:hypothetical protein